MKRYKLIGTVCLICFSCFLNLSFAEGSDLMAGNGTLENASLPKGADLPMMENITITFNASNFTIEKYNGYDVINMSEFSERLVAGDPMLPGRINNVLLPSEVDYFSLKLEVVSAKSQVLDGVFNIKPTPQSAPLTENVSEVGNATGLDYSTAKYNASEIQKSSVYSTDADYPENVVSLLVPGQMRKWKYVPVEFVPFRYNPVTGKLTLIESVTVKISYDLMISSPAGASELMADTVLDDQAPGMFVNYQESKGWYLGEEQLKSEPSATIGYVIITTNAIRANSAKLNAFITHKQNVGYTVQVVTENDFGSLTAPSPNLRADKIRQWLKNNYVSKKIKYVLLIGDPSPYESGEGDIPMKMCYPRYAEIRYPEDKDSPTDAFYADLTGNWDVNGNGIFGEWADYTTGGVNFAAEVYVGRIPVYNAEYTTLDSILQKIINYESSSSTAWRKGALLPMSFADSGTDGAYLAEQMRNNYLSSYGYTTWRMYQKGSGPCEVNSDFSCNQELRGGTIVRDRWAANDYGIMTWWGHGSATSTSIGYDGCWDDEMMYSSYCTNLDNSHPSFAFLCSCSNGYPEATNNLQYSVLKNGGITSVSATRVSWYLSGLEDFVMSTTNSGFAYEYVKRLVGKLPAGDALMQMKSSMVPYHADWLMNFFDFNIYGDPSVSVLLSSGVLGDTIGIYNPATAMFYLNYNNLPGAADVSVNFGPTGMIPIVGDWNNDGKDTLGVYNKNTAMFYLKNTNTPGPADIAVNFGPAGMKPIAGDWNNDGTDTVGVYNPSTAMFYLKNTNTPGPADVAVNFGPTGMVPIAGDWNNDGTDTLGVYSPSTATFYLKNSNQPGVADITVNFGPPNMSPVVGDWNNDGTDTVGVYNPSTSAFYLKNSNQPGVADITVNFGPTGMTPIAGDWNG